MQTTGTAPIVGKPWRHLYSSHFLSAFGDRLWQFAVPILFITIFPTTLLPSAIFMFCLYGAKTFLMPSVGNAIDRVDRLQLVRVGTFGQSFCLCISAGLLGYMGLDAVRGDGSANVAKLFHSWAQFAVFVVLIAIGICGDLLQAASTIGIERDWVVCIAGDEEPRQSAAGQPGFLPRLNATMRRIDLFCKLCAPMGFGIAMGFFENKGVQTQVLIGSGIVFGWSALSALPVYVAWRRVYNAYASLRETKFKAKKSTNPFTVFAKGVNGFVRHKAFLASLGYCCLYFTVLSDHHPLSTAYMSQHGVNTALLGAARGGGAVMGIIATVVFPFLLSARCGCPLVRVATLSVWAFVLCVLPLATLFIHGVPEALLNRSDAEDGALRSYVMLAVIVISRFFLWCFDLGIVQIMQEQVVEEQRGEMGAMQAATCQLMEFLMSILAMVFADGFVVLVFASCCGVLMAALIFSIWGLQSSRANAKDGLLRSAY